MTKQELNSILKPGESLDTIPIIDFNSKEVKELLIKTKQMQKEALNRKKINWEKLSKIYITI